MSNFGQPSMIFAGLTAFIPHARPTYARLCEADGRQKTGGKLVAKEVESGEVLSDWTPTPGLSRQSVHVILPG